MISVLRATNWNRKKWPIKILRIPKCSKNFEKSNLHEWTYIIIGFVFKFDRFFFEKFLSSSVFVLSSCVFVLDVALLVTRESKFFSSSFSLSVEMLSFPVLKFGQVDIFCLPVGPLTSSGATSGGSFFSRFELIRRMKSSATQITVRCDSNWNAVLQKKNIHFLTRYRNAWYRNALSAHIG